MQSLIESALSNKSKISKYLFENNSSDLINKMCVMSHLYESCEFVTHADKLEYVEKHFPIAYDVVSKYKMYESRLNSIIARLCEEDGGAVAPTNVTAVIDATTPRIYPKKKKLKESE